MPCKGAVFVSNNRVCILDSSGNNLYLMSTAGIAQSKFDRQAVEFPGMENLAIQ